MDRNPGWTDARTPCRRGPVRVEAPGFTLVELIVTMGLMMLVFVCVWQSFAAQRDTYRAQEQMSDIQQNLRVALDTVERDLRMAGARAPQGVGPILQAAPFQMVLFADSDGSCLCGLQGTTDRSYRIQVAEDVCWGGMTSSGRALNHPDGCPTLRTADVVDTSDPLNPRIVAANGTDTPVFLSWYGSKVAAGNPQYAHAEMIGWTMDRLSTGVPGSADPFSGEGPCSYVAPCSIDQGDEARVGLNGGCSSSSITPDDDRDLDLSEDGHPLFVLRRWTRKVLVYDPLKQPAVSRVASGLVGPCAPVLPMDDLGTLSTPWPLFAYWIDKSNGTSLGQDGKITNNCVTPLDAATEDPLWGDTDGDCKFSDAEYNALTAVSCTNPDSSASCDLKNIIRVDVHMRGESAQKNIDTTATGNGYRFRYIDGSVWIRQARGKEH